MTFDIQPKHLQNELIKLVPLHENDFEELYEVASDPLVWEQHPNKLRYQREVFQNRPKRRQIFWQLLQENFSPKT